MQLFVLTNHCTSKIHCKTCRNLEGGRPWRASLQKYFTLPQNQVDFTCPYGLSWQQKTEQTTAIVGSATPNIAVAPTPKTACLPCQRKKQQNK